MSSTLNMHAGGKVCLEKVYIVFQDNLLYPMHACTFSVSHKRKSFLNEIFIYTNKFVFPCLC